MSENNEVTNLLDDIIDFENGEISAEKYINLFAYLIQTGYAWKFQGRYGRAAADLIDGGYIKKDGTILKHIEVTA